MGLAYYITVVPNAKTASVEVLEDAFHLRVRVNAPAKEHKANIRLLEILAEHLGVSMSALRFVGGVRGRQKVVEMGN